MELGQFAKCDHIFDTAAASCLAKVGEYVDANPCHTDLAEAYSSYTSSGSESALEDIDYMLYSLCEQCCDCVPMGVNLDDYDDLAASGNLMDVTRGNCPAHAVFDICKLHPFVVGFVSGGSGNEASNTSGNKGEICTKLDAWVRSAEGRKWQTNPETRLESSVADFLNGLTKAASCTDRSTWETCWDMENAQRHLGDVSEGDEAAPYEELSDEETVAVTTTEASETDESTTTDAASSDTSDASITTDEDADSAALADDEETENTSDTDDSETTTDQVAEPENDSGSTGTASSTTETEPGSFSTSASVDGGEGSGSASGDGSEESASSSGDEGENQTSIDDSSIATGDSPTSAGDSSQEEETDSDGGSSSSTDSDGSSGSEDKNSSSCFPGSATVEIECGSIVLMSSLRIGDSVRVSENSFSPVYMFSHRLPHTMSEYIRIQTGTKTLSLTAGHYLPMNRQSHPTAAKHVAIGDEILTTNSWETVVAISRYTAADGLYNPHTLDGDIVVNGIITSTYTEAVAPSVAETLLLPIRFAYVLGVMRESTAGKLFADGVQFRFGL